MLSASCVGEQLYFARSCKEHGKMQELKLISGASLYADSFIHGCWQSHQPSCVLGRTDAARTQLLLCLWLLHRESDGHGTHVASIAAGNYGVATPKSPASSVISGMAPRARLAIYKVRPGWAQSSALTALANRWIE